MPQANTASRSLVMKRAAPGILFTLLVIGVYADPLFARRSFAGHDLLSYNLPIEKAMHDAYARGRLPVWMPEISGGRPLLPNPNSGALYPVRMLLAWLPFGAAMRLFPVLHWIVAGAGVMLLVRALEPEASSGAAFLAAVTYVFSGVGVSEVLYPNVHPGMALLPCVIWAVCRRDANGARKVLLLALLVGIDLLAGDLFTVGMALSAALACVFVAENRQDRRRTLGQTLIACSLGLLLAAPQILATALWIPQTRRAVTGLRLGEILAYSIHPARLLELVVPFPFGATWEIDSSSIWGFTVFGGAPNGLFASFYAGALPVVGLATIWRSNAKAARVARLLFLGGLAFSIPGTFLPARLADRIAPVALRFPEKFAVVITLALALFAVLVVDEARRWRRVPRWSLFIGAVLAAFALAALAFRAPVGRGAVALVGEDPSLSTVAAKQLSQSLAEGGLLWMITLVGLELLREGAGSRRAVVLAMLSLVPIAADRRIARTFREDSVFAPTAFARLVSQRDPQGSFRVFGASVSLLSRVGLAAMHSDPAYLEFPRRTWFDYTSALWKRGVVFNRDYDRGDFSRLNSLRHLVTEEGRLMDLAPLLASLSLRFTIQYRDEPAIPGNVRLGGDAVQTWYENPEALPDVRLATRWEKARSAPEALGLLVSGLPPGGIVVESGERGSGRSSGGATRVLESRPERLVVESKSPEPTWLFVLRGFWPYRDVRVDGRAVESVPAQLAFSAIPVPAGRHRVEWEERIPGFEASRWGPVLFLLVAALTVSRKRR